MEIRWTLQTHQWRLLETRVSLVIRGVVRGGAGEGVLRRHNLLPYVTGAVIETLNGVAVTGESSKQ